MRFITSDEPPKASEDTGLKVLACGLWRCSTSSLQTAFESHLGLSPSMHGAYIMPSIHRLQLCSAACLETKSTTKRRKILRELFTGYPASSDFPGMAFVDDLVAMYPDVKLVLNKRSSAEVWSKSINKSLAFFASWKYWAITYWIPQSYWHWKLYDSYAHLLKERFGIDKSKMFDPETYEIHNEWVRQVAAKNNKELLEWDASQGWAPLCEFLGQKVPEEEFPVVNDAAAIKELKRLLVLRGLYKWGFYLSCIQAIILTLAFSRILRFISKWTVSFLAS